MNDPMKINSNNSTMFLQCSEKNAKSTATGNKGFFVNSIKNVGMKNILFDIKTLDRLSSTQADKSAIADVLNFRKTMNFAGSDTSTILKKIKIDPTGGNISRIFHSDDQIVLARTLTRGSQNSKNQTVKTPGKVERNTLNNRLGNLRIILTPSTMITRDLHVSTISNHPDRPKWSKMPSVLYSTPLRTGIEYTGALDNFKKSYGNVLSFASNTGFTEEFTKAANSDRHTHSELLKLFQSQEVVLRNLKPGAPYNKMKDSLLGLKEQILGYRSDEARKSTLYSDGSVPHNEVINRLYIWDVIAIDVGHGIDDGLESAIEISLARDALSRELKAIGTEHPLYKTFLFQQLSIENNECRDLKSTEMLYERITEQEKNDVLNAMIAKLDKPVELCQYSPAESSLNGVDIEMINKKQLIDSLDNVLSSRFGSPLGA